ncbi:MAG: tRNA (N(6)-L-threonylcarbamoyladenosine(37)-C(2))-methylthiotransferase MtaB [Firmicutes bacterium]|nr:tRNA (N(6)-L-threonylcarbamoyladenosine(37)-C(2))-methylthiotransferase MtaB [Bacillota bacterium]
MNQFDTAGLAEKFRERGFEVVSPGEQADIYVVNTCTVTKTAEQKARQLIRKIKREDPGAVLAVTGCYAQTNPESVKALPGVDLVTGVAGRENLPELVEEYLASGLPLAQVLPEEQAEMGFYRPVFTDKTRAFLKIEDGCDSYCSYCKIPFARGPVRSLPPPMVLAELRRFFDLGFKEVVLVGIHLGHYGRDRGWNLAGLLRMIVQEMAEAFRGGSFRLRLGSLEPVDITAEFMEVFFKAGFLCPHLHIPLQSGSRSVLARMNRPYTPEEYARLLADLRRHLPDLAVSTDLMVGFPGESEEEFQETLDFLEKQEFSRVHVFPFSPREGTRAAEMPGHLPRRVIEERKKAALAVAGRVAAGYRQGLLGKTEEVLVEEETAPGCWEGLSGRYLRVRLEGSFTGGTFVPVRIINADREPLLGRPLEKEEEKS